MKVPESETTNLTHTNLQLIQSLFDSIPQTQSFKGKWSIIRTKLDSLRANLSDLVSDANASVSGNNPLTLDLLHSLSATLTHALSLCEVCYSPNPIDGKLKTQSDIDSVSAKLDCHMSDLEVLIRSGVLYESPAFHGASATASMRETVRAECRNLVTRLQISEV